MVFLGRNFGLEHPNSHIITASVKIPRYHVTKKDFNKPQDTTAKHTIMHQSYHLISVITFHNWGGREREREREREKKRNREDARACCW